MGTYRVGKSAFTLIIRYIAFFDDCFFCFLYFLLYICFLCCCICYYIEDALSTTCDPDVG